MTITHKLSIDLLRQEPTAPIDAVQHDCGRVLALTLHANGIPWTIPEGIDLLVRYRKSDGIGGEYDRLPDGKIAWSARDNVLTIALAPQVLTAAGKTVLSVLLTKDHAAIRTFDILLQVQPDLHESIAESETYIHRSCGSNGLTEIGAAIMRGDIPSIILLGDEVTDGVGGLDYNGSHTAAPSTNTRGYCWANAFQRFTGPRYGTRVRNAGMCGTDMAEQTAAALEFVTKDDFVIWLTGAGDRANPAVYTRNLQKNLAAVREKSAGLLVISMPPLPPENEEYGITMQEIDELVAKAAAGFVPYLSMYQAYADYCEARDIAIEDGLADSFLPNNWGHCLLFKVLCKHLGLPLNPYENYQYGTSWWWANEPADA